MNKIFGLDFGTTNSALSVNIDGRVKMVDIDPFNKEGETLKSVIYYDDEEKCFFVGQEAVDLYIENDACGRYVQSVKSFLPNKVFDRTEIGRKFYELDELIAIILNEIKIRGEKKVGEELDDVVLGRPVIFSDDEEIDAFAENRLVSAAKIAGFKNVYIQLEPVVAALSFESTLHNNEERIVLVGDFGGGTSDFTVVKTRGGQQKIKLERREDILSTGGVYIGGDTFDSQIVWNRIAKYFGRFLKIHSMQSKIAGGEAKDDFPVTILKQLCKWHYIPKLHTPKTMQHLREFMYLADNKVPIKNLKNLIEGNCGYMLFRAIEKAKCKLSSEEKAQTFFKEYKLIIEEEISRPEFEEMIHPEILKIESCVETVIRDAGLRYSDIDVVFLTGGSSHIPCIKKVFERRFGTGKMDQTNAFTSVAYGLGVHGYLYL